MKSTLELQAELAQAIEDLTNFKPPHLTQDDIECVSDNYQAHLEYDAWAIEQRELIRTLEAEIAEDKAVDNYYQNEYGDNNIPS